MLCSDCKKTERPVCTSCSEEKDKEIKELQEYGVDLIDKKDEKIRVRWDVYYRYEVNEEIRRKMNYLLLSLRVFSREMERSWIILAGHILTSLCIDGYYFNLEEDALEYFRKRYGRAEYSCKVLYVDKVYRQ
jgi:hypothetical protein